MKKGLFVIIFFAAFVIQVFTEEPQGWNEFKLGMSFAEAVKILGNSSYDVETHDEVLGYYKSWTPYKIKNIFIGHIKCEVELLFELPQTEITESTLMVSKLRQINIGPEKDEDKNEVTYNLFYDKLAIKYGKPQIEKKDPYSFTKSSSSTWVFTHTLIELGYSDFGTMKAFGLSYKIKEVSNL